MNNENRADRVSEARAAYAARREAFRQAAAPPGKDASPQAVEATLASISEEVTAEAIERRREKASRAEGRLKDLDSEASSST